MTDSLKERKRERERERERVRIVSESLAFSDNAAFHGAMGCGQKSFKIVWWCHELLSGFLAKGNLPRASSQPRWSLMIRVIMKLSWGLCTDLLASALQPRKTPENLS